MARAFAAGDRVLLVDAKRRRHLITLVGRRRVPHARRRARARRRSSASREGVDRAHDARIARLVAVRPTLAEYVLEMPRGAQVIYPKDLGPILMLADVFPGARVLESGVGSGALTLALLRAVGEHRARHRLRDPRRLRPPRPQPTSKASSVPTCRSTVEVRDVYDGIELDDLDRVMLDLPEPWRVVKHAEAALHPGGILLAYLPTIGQVAAPARGARGIARSAWSRSLEVLQRTWHVDGQSVRPDHRMVAHTGFLTHAAAALRRA